MNDNPPIIKIPPPLDTGTDVSVHLAYVRRDMDDLKNIVKSERVERQQQHGEILAKLEEMKNSYPTRAEFVEFKTYVDREKTDILKDATATHLQLHTEIERLKATLEYYPLVTKVVFGGISIILVTVFSAIIYLVIKK